MKKTSELSARARKSLSLGLGPWKARQRQQNEALPRTSGHGPSGYTCPELRPDPSIDPARMVAHGLPSRVGDLLYWPDGRVTDLDGGGV